jgi:hypothetical protein
MAVVGRPRVGHTLIGRFHMTQELWFDRGQLWLQTLRESAYRVIGAAAQTGVLFRSPDFAQVRTVL